MTTVFVIGGTGTVGSQVVSRLVARHHRTRILAHQRTPAVPAGVEVVLGDLASGIGPRDAVAGVDAIIQAPSRFQAVQEVDVVGTQHMIAAAKAQDTTGRLPYLVYISIVGVDRSTLPYYVAKYAVESLVAQAGLP